MLGSAHTVRRRYLGRLNTLAGSVSGWFATILTPVSCLFAFIAHMSLSAIIFLLVTLPVVPLVTGLRLLPVLVALPLRSCFTLGGNGYPDRVHVRDLEVGKLLELRQLEVPDAPNTLSSSFVEGNDSCMHTGVSDRE